MFKQTEEQKQTYENAKKELIDKINSNDIIGTYELYGKFLCSKSESMDEEYINENELDMFGIEYDENKIVNQGKLYLQQAIETLMVELLKLDAKKELQRCTDAFLNSERNYDENIAYYANKDQN